MFYTEWEILLVDSNPEALAQTKHVLQAQTIYGLPVNVHTAESEAHALAFLRGRPDKFFLSIAVTFVNFASADLGAEDAAPNFELIQAIREEFLNPAMQIVVFTDRPELAPEGFVVDHYDINGYFTKAEATDDKLTSLVKMGVRQFMAVDWLQRVRFFLSFALQHAYSRREMEESIATGLMQNDQLRMILSPESVEKNQIVHAIQINGRIIFSSVGLDEEAAAKMIGSLVQLEGQPLGDGRDLYIRGEENHQCLKIAASDATPEFVYVFVTVFQPFPHVIRDLHNGIRDVCMIWQRAD